MMLSAKEEKGKTFEKIGIHLIRKKHNLVENQHLKRKQAYLIQYNILT